VKRAFSRQQKLTIVSGILAIVAILVMLQLWLLSATMNAFLGGDSAAIVPALAASAGCFLLNLGLLDYLYRLERR
jgi:flagellar biosynthesis/type III secretory pathway M-ring protein FliF/YscJ